MRLGHDLLQNAANKIAPVSYHKNTIFAHLDEYLNAFLFFPSKSGRTNRAEILFINLKYIFSDAMPKYKQEK